MKHLVTPHLNPAANMSSLRFHLQDSHLVSLIILCDVETPGFHTVTGVKKSVCHSS